MSENLNKIDQICLHCENSCGFKVKFCGDCGTVKQREEMDIENRKILGNENWHNPCSVKRVRAI